MTDEKLIRLQDVPVVVQELRPGSKLLHWTTVRRWTGKGCRGVKLWSTPVGWRRMTSRSAVAEFLDRLDALNSTAEPPAETKRQLDTRLRAKSRALEEAGW